MSDSSLLTMGRAVLETEAQAVLDLRSRLDAHFVQACRILLGCRGRIVVTGMGKSGHIGSKIAATLASTGSPAFFVHPGEASHGDLGMITAQDVLLALSYSGETAEIVTLLPILKRLGVPSVALTGRPTSTLATAADVHLDVSVAKEACPLNLAPTASSTATLAMGDALAVAMLDARGFTAEDFARSHPGGSLGRRLLVHVGDIMRSGNALPVVREDASLSDALLEITSKGMGMTAVVDANNRIVGIYTDGDLRRSFERGVDVRHTGIAEVMSAQPQTIVAGALAAEALAMMEQRRINAVLVANDGIHLDGALNMHDLLTAGVV
ncbi:MAG: KpsF/GutQ family sugar-phosphate isomerase [Oceanococcaceae bacterium]